MNDTPTAQHRPRFATTRWSRIVALRENDTTDVKTNFGALVVDYWYPCYAYLRRRGLSQNDAEEVTQDFFASIFEHDGLKSADLNRGRFRNFLVAALRHHLANHHRRESTQKRGGLVAKISLDFEKAENRYAMEPVDLETPQQLFDRRWALTLLENSLDRVRSVYVDNGKAAIFDSLKEYLAAGESTSLLEVGRQLGMTDSATRVALHRLRHRCRDMLRAEVARTLESNHDLDSELEILRGWFG